MHLQEERLRSHLEGYPFIIQEIQQGENDWYTLTDRGRKRIIHCQDENILRWSHNWREYLAARGFRYVERYLATVQNTHWISEAGGCYALSDYWEQENTWVEHSVLQIEGYRGLGEILALIHSCFDGAAEIYRGRYRRKGMLNETRIKNSYRQLHAIMKQIKSAQVGAKEKWLLYNLSRLMERVQKAEALYEASGVENDQTPLSFAYIPLTSLVYWEEAWYITGLHNPLLVPRHEDTLSLLEQIYGISGEEGIRSFLSAYADRRELPMEEKNYLLALLSYPLPISSRLESGFAAWTEIESIAQELRLQSRREQLLRCVIEMQGFCREAPG